MFEVGFTEIILILGLALVVLGPEKLPGLAQKVGRWTGRARAMARQLRTQLEHEVTMDDLTRSRPTHNETTHNEPGHNETGQYTPASDTSSQHGPSQHEPGTPPEPAAHAPHAADTAHAEQTPNPEAAAAESPSTTPNTRPD